MTAEQQGRLGIRSSLKEALIQEIDLEVIEVVGQGDGGEGGSLASPWQLQLLSLERLHGIHNSHRLP